MISNELERLVELRNEGALTDEEFELAKKRVLASADIDAEKATQIFGFTPINWITLMHLSPLLWWAGGLGVAVPVVMWLLSRDQSRQADRHGRVVVNWLLSLLVYGVVCVPLVFIGIGIPMGAVLGLLSLALPIVGAVRASEGRLWPYPLSIEFFSTSPEPESEAP
ncbi:MAG: hypothetical protein RL215_2421 [Planctomycetota bacterium]|jgi:uncharacterized Tic20 family protein